MPDTRVHVDFNDIRHGRLRALSRNAEDPSAIAPGAQVELWDDDGNTARGRVVEVADRGLVWFELIRGTWRDPVDPPESDPQQGLTWWLGSGVVLSTVHGSGFADVILIRALSHADFEDYYKLSLVTGAAPMTADR
jgi:hypothetical protein